MRGAVPLFVGIVSCFVAVVCGDELDDLDDLSHMIDNLEAKTAHTVGGGRHSPAVAAPQQLACRARGTTSLDAAGSP